MVYISSINWLSKEAEEAEVVISDGIYKIICFAHPLRYSEGEVIDLPINALDPVEITKADSNQFEIKRMSLGFEYYVTGVLKSRESGIIQVGEIEIEVEEGLIPSDLIDKDYVTFKCSRLDVW